MKNLFLTILILCAFPAYAQTLQGGVFYTVESAREEAFENVESGFSKDLINSYLVDNNYKENMNMLLRGATDLKDRTLCKFSSGIYGIRYNYDPYRAYYYTKDGKLEYVDKKSRLEYPHKVATYNLNGSLIGSALYISKYEQYIFDINKKLTTHWIGNKGYDSSGRLIKSRVYAE